MAAALYISQPLLLHLFSFIMAPSKVGAWTITSWYNVYSFQRIQHSRYAWFLNQIAVWFDLFVKSDKKLTLRLKACFETLFIMRFQVIFLEAPSQHWLSRYIYKFSNIARTEWEPKRVVFLSYKHLCKIKWKPPLRDFFVAFHFGFL